VPGSGVAMIGRIERRIVVAAVTIIHARTAVRVALQPGEWITRRPGSEADTAILIPVIVKVPKAGALVVIAIDRHRADVRRYPAHARLAQVAGQLAHGGDAPA